MSDLDQLVDVEYTNHRGVRSVRRISPQRLWFGSTEWHPEEQWLLDVIDVDKDVHRTFALDGIHTWRYKLEPRPLTVDQARTQDLERRGLHGAVVRSDGLRAVVELDHVRDFDALLRWREPGQPTLCVYCRDNIATRCAACSAGAE